MANGELEIQKMLVQRLRRRIESLEKERDRLVESLHRLANETVARVFVLEEERDGALVQKRAAEESVGTLERKLDEAKKEIRQLRDQLDNLRA